ncbi:hypothetical protein BS78_08G167700 [Paspalum vaginatum]|nr:hypothetical protein BS78_08G167700 [Paspalum vaginatum]
MPLLCAVDARDCSIPPLPSRLLVFVSHRPHTEAGPLCRTSTAARLPAPQRRRNGCHRASPDSTAGHLPHPTALAVFPASTLHLAGSPAQRARLSSPPPLRDWPAHASCSSNPNSRARAVPPPPPLFRAAAPPHPRYSGLNFCWFEAVQDLMALQCEYSH